MFTGLVEEVGHCEELVLSETGALLRVSGEVTRDMQLGDSLAINGCCLTVTSTSGGVASFDVLGETLRRTNLGTLAPGAKVNLERSLAVGARLGGHFVQGHVDTVSRVKSLTESGNDLRLEFELPAEFSQYVAFKGSIAINGTSLTVAEVTDDTFAVWIIPHTRDATNLGDLRAGDPVNLEFDILAKYAERLLERVPRT